MTSSYLCELNKLRDGATLDDGVLILNQSRVDWIARHEVADSTRGVLLPKRAARANKCEQGRYACRVNNRILHRRAR